MLSFVVHDLFHILDIYNDPKLVKELNEDFERLSPYLFVYHKNSANKDVGKKIREFYFGNKQIDGSTKDEVTNVLVSIIF